MEKYKNMTLEQLESLQDDSTNDEEIDEDMAFNSDDEEKYGKYFSTSITVSNNMSDKNVSLPIPLQHNTVRIINVPHGHKVSLSSICLDISKVDYQQIKLMYKCTYPANQSAIINDYICLSNYLSMKNGGSGLQPTTPINLQVVGPCKLEFKVQIMPEKYSSGGSINIFGILLPTEDELIDNSDVFADAFMSEDESITESSDNATSTNSDGSDEDKDEADEKVSSSKKRKLEDSKKNIETPFKKKTPVESKTPATISTTTSQPENTTEKKLTKKQRKKLAKEKAKQLEETLSASRNETTPDTTDEKKSKKKKKQASAELNESRWSGTRERRLNGGLIISDLILGSGAPVKPGKRISLHYTGSLRSTKQVFDKNNSKQHPLVFRQGTGEVIRGLERGLEGMKAGGERVITIPSKLGYGSKGSGASIPPDSDLVFEVKVLKVG